MRAILVTPLEQAIIDALRREHITMRCNVCDTLEIPLGEQELEYRLESTYRHGLMFARSDTEIAANIERVKETQEENMRRFKLNGYGSKAEFGQGKTRPYLTVNGDLL